MNLSTVRLAIYNWAKLTTAAEVYWGEPNAPRPPPPAVRMKIIGGPTQIGHDTIDDKTGSGTDFTINGLRSIMVSITAYGDTAQQMISDLQTSLVDPASQATLDQGGLSSLKTSPLRDISQFLDTKYEQRFQMDLTLLVAEQKTIQPGVIEKIEGSGTVGTETISIAVDKTP